MRKIFIYILSLLLFCLVLMRLLWYFDKSTPVNILILDKTVLTEKAWEHASLNWILKHLKIIKPDSNFYEIKSDYYGFFPIKRANEYKIKDFSLLSKNQLDSIINKTDMAYYADNYGIYENEWYERKNYLQEHSRKIYGGLDQNDLYILKGMLKSKKLFIGEFNLFADPTTQTIREQTEDTLSIKWLGWTLRYYDSFDTIKNKELPKWVVTLYQREHGFIWPFKNGGIVFVNEDERICILEDIIDLNNSTAQIYSKTKTSLEFGVPEIIDYPYWADIIKSNDSINETLAYYKIQTTETGDSLLNRYNIPKVFPAIIRNIKTSNYYYFCGDFCDNQISLNGSNFKGIELINQLFRDRIDNNNRKPFFWCYYLPLMSKILNDNFIKK